MEREKVWVPSQEDGWTVGVIESISGDTYNVYSDGKTTKVKKDQVLPYKEEHNNDVNDMITLTDAHEAPILQNLQERFKRDQIYTYIGPVVISVNPFKPLDCYSDNILNKYLKTSPDQLPPHLYSIAHNAYNSLIMRGESQSVIISGESGAGKTEATKIILQFLTAATHDSSGGLADRILATNPVLEAFGNAKTVRNNNSSRFGKFISVAFDPGGSIAGAQIENYLLETTRVISQAATERNYHIFYQLIEGASDEERRRYLLYESANAYRYLTNGTVKVDHTDDKKNFLKLKSSFDILGLSKDEQSDLMCLISAILHLGNIEFQGEDAVTIKDGKSLACVSKLLKTPDKLLTTSLTIRFFSGGGRPSGYNIPLNRQQAIENRDALAKALYSRLFDFLVKRLNRPLMGDYSDLSDKKSIGVLDIYGFEIFTINSLEQFCINYANEKLHQQFNEHMFKAEQALYMKEGVPWEKINFVDNQDCIDLIESGQGVLSMLDEEGRIPRGSEMSLLDKMKKKHVAHSKFKMNVKKPDIFSIVHYAGAVEYTIDNFIQKNKDTVNKDLISTLWSSELDLIQEMFAEEFNESKTMSNPTSAMDRKNKWDPKSRDKDASKATVTKRFQQSLTKLVTMLANSQRHYVRCIKPNDLQQSLVFSGNKVLTQLKCNGVFETIKMRKAGYASHTPYQDFYNRFAVLGIPNANQNTIVNFLQKFLDTSQWISGQTKVFLKEKAVEKLEIKRRDMFMKNVLVIQTYIRSWYSKNKLSILKSQLAVRKEQSTIVIQKLIRSYYARRQLIQLILLRRKKIEEEKRREEERRKEEERKRLEEEKKLKEEELKKKLLEEKRRKEEEAKKLEERKRKEEDRKLEEKFLLEESNKSDAKRKDWAATVLQKYIRSLYAKRALIVLIVQERRRREEEKKKRMVDDVSKKNPSQLDLSASSREELARRRLEERRRQLAGDNTVSASDEIVTKAATTIQKYFRSWKAKRIMITLILGKIQQLKTEKVGNTTTGNREEDRAKLREIKRKELQQRREDEKHENGESELSAADKLRFRNKQITRRSMALAEIVDSIDTEAAALAREIIEDDEDSDDYGKKAKLMSSSYKIYYADDPVFVVKPFIVTVIPKLQTSRSKLQFQSKVSEKNIPSSPTTKKPQSHRTNEKEGNEEEFYNLHVSDIKDGRTTISGTSDTRKSKKAPSIIKMAFNKIPGSLSLRGLKKRQPIPNKMRSPTEKESGRSTKDDDPRNGNTPQSARPGTTTKSPNSAYNSRSHSPNPQINTSQNGLKPNASPVQRTANQRGIRKRSVSAPMLPLVPGEDPEQHEK